MKKRIVVLGIVMAVFLLTICTVTASYGDPRLDGWYNRNVSEDGSAVSATLQLMPNEYSINGVLSISANELSFVTEEGIKITYTDRNGAEQTKYLTKAVAQSENQALVIDDISAETSTITASYTYAVHDVHVWLKAEYTGYNEENELGKAHSRNSASSSGSSNVFAIEDIISDNELTFDKTTGTITGCTDTTRNILLLKDEIDGVEVKAIADDAFANMTSLKYVCLDTYNELMIGNNAFKNCASLSGVYLRRGIKSIGTDAFSGCNKIDEVQYDGWKTELNAIDIKTGNSALTEHVVYYKWSYDLRTNYKPEETEKFYYKLDGKNVHLSHNGTMDFEEDTEKNIIISCYDNGKLIKAESLPLNASVNGVSFNNFDIELPNEPHNLTVKTFAWSGLGECIPLCDAAELSDIPKSAYRVMGRVVATGKNGSLYNGQVDFRIETSDNFEGEVIDDPYDGYTCTMYADDTDIERHIMEPVTAYVTKDENDEYHILKYEPVENVQQVALTKSDIDLENSDENKLVTTDGRELDISSLDYYYINGTEADISDNLQLLDFIDNMQTKYSKIQLLNVSAEEGMYDRIFIESYFSAVIDEISHGKDSDKIYLSDADINANYVVIDNENENCIYNFYNEKMEKCDPAQLENYIGKTIYIAYDYYGDLRDSYFYDFILENSQPAQTAVTHTDRLSRVDSTATLRYSDSDKTAILDGSLIFDSDGNMPFDINLAFLKNGEVISTETIKTTTAMSKLQFGYEAYFGEEYRYTGKKYTLPQKPDKAVLSFDTGTDAEIPEIDVPIISSDSYKVYGRVTETSRMNTDIAAGQVKFRVERAEYFDGEYVGHDGDQIYTMYYGATNAPEMLREYSCAYIHKDENGEYTIEAIESAAPGKSVTLSAEDFDEAKSADSYGNLYFYPAGETRNSVKYSISDNYDIYINGVQCELNEDELKQYIDIHSSAEIKLMKETKMGSTSTETQYNLIMISSYKTLIVSDVIAESNQITINFDDRGSDVNGTKMVLYLDDDTYTYDFTFEGQPINPADFRKNDVLSVAYNDTGDTNIQDSSFYDVLVSRDTVNGKCTTVNSDGDEWTIGGTKYKAAQGMYPAIEVSAEYTLYLDHFGRIAKAEENSVNKKLGILKNIYKKVGGDWYAQIITKEGVEEEYKVDDGKVAEYQKILGLEEQNNDGVTYNNNHKKSDFYPQQVIEYSIASSTNKITIKNNGEALAADYEVADTEYKENGTKIGLLKMADSTVIIDISGADDDDIKVISPDNLADGNEYSAVGFDMTTSGDRYCRYVLITKGPIADVAVMEYYDGGTAYLHTQDDMLTLQLSNDNAMLNVLQETRSGSKAACVVYEDGQLLSAELVEPQKITAVYANGAIGEYEVPKHIICRYPEIGATRATCNCLIEGETYDVYTYTKGSRKLTVIDGQIDEAHDKFMGILTEAVGTIAIIYDEEGDMHVYRASHDTIEQLQNVTTPVGICYDYDGEELITAKIIDKTEDITGEYKNGKIGTYTVPEYVYYYDYGDRTAYKIPSTALVENEEYTVIQFAKDSYAIDIIYGGALTKGEELKYGILKNLYKKAGGSWCVQIINDEGKEEEYPIDDNRAETYKSLLNITNSDGIEYGYGEKIEKYPNQAIQYSVNAVGKLYLKSDTLLDGVTAENREYKQSSSNIDTINIDDDTVILDASGADDDKIVRINKNQLVDGVAYTACGYDRATSGDRCYRFVIITSGTNSYNSRTQIAVFKSIDLVEIDGNLREVFNLIYDGEEKQYILSDELYGDDYRFEEGDALIFMTDYDNEITNITPIFSQNGMINQTTWYDFNTYALSSLQNVISNNNWSDMLQDGYSDEMDIVFGVAVNKIGNRITLCKTLDDDKYANYDTGLELDCSNAKVYTYDFAASGDLKLSTDYSLMATPNYRAYLTTNNIGQDLLDITNEDVVDEVVFAVARIDGNTVKEIYQIVNYN